MRTEGGGQIKMLSEHVYPLDPDTLELFALKGIEDGCATPQARNANGVKVRRVMQIIRDFAKKPFDQLRILDFACGEGVYAIEAALRGAKVVALDARTERMNEGAKAAKRLGLENLGFEQTDVRNVNVGSHGQCDVILILGILYHLDYGDAFSVLQNVCEMCEQFVVIDTHIALRGQHQVQHNGQSYEGIKVREHADDDPEELRRSRLLASVDNPLSFWFTRESLFRVLADVGFTSVCECHVPLEPFKPEDRITIIAAKEEPVKVSSYPWVNKSDDEIKRLLENLHQSVKPSRKKRVKGMINGVLRPFGIEIRRI
ncbi:MAG: methyltransferase domain-containing protein [Acidobacteria bacterium]|nr:methyltransferase domain-containing protein [Acidobacteriota bacterium]